MEAFVIQCTTCRARLKVSDSALIGDIVECPKCSSFVQVTPPPGWQQSAAGASSTGKAASGSSSGAIPVSSAVQQPNDSKAQSAARKAAALGAVNPPPLPGKSGIMPATANVSPGSASAAPTSRSTTSDRAGNSSVGNSATGNSSLSKSSPGKSATSGSLLAGSAAGKSGSTLIVPDLPSEPTAFSRVWGLARQHPWIALGSVASLLAMTTLAWLASGSKTGSAPTAEPQTTTVALTTDASSAASDDRANNLSAADQSSDTNDTDAVESEPMTGPAADAASDAPATNDPDETLAADQAERRPTADTGSRSAKSESQTALDPLDPTVCALATEPEPLASTNPGVAPPPIPGNSTSGRMSSAAEAGSDGSQEDGATAARPDDADSSDEFDGAKQARLVAHLQDKLPAIEFKDVPLDQFVSFLSDFSTVSIVLDSESLAAAGKGTKTKVTVKLAGGTVKEALRASLTRHGLTFHVEPKRVVITAAAAKP